MSLYQVPENIKNANDLTAKLELLKNIKRSFSVYRNFCFYHADVGSGALWF